MKVQLHLTITPEAGVMEAFEQRVGDLSQVRRSLDGKVPSDEKYLKASDLAGDNQMFFDSINKAARLTV